MRECCDPRAVFELAEGNLPPEKEQEVRAHLARCEGCRRAYRRERDLSASLGTARFSGPGTCSVYRTVAMALPTRSVRARLLWSALALAVVLAGLAALELSVASPVMAAVDAFGTLWGSLAGLVGVVYAVTAVAGGAILVALAVGALLDLLLAGVFLLAARRTRRA